MHIIGELRRCVGLRVTVRLLDDTGHTRDIVGTLLDGDRIEKRDGTVMSFAIARVTHWRVIPKHAAPAGPGSPLRLRVQELETAMADTCPADVTVRHGEWLLRASMGITQRANSAVPLGKPLGTVDDAIAHVIEFSRAQGIIPAVRVPLPTGEGLDQLLNSLGWAAIVDSYVLVHDTHALVHPDAELLIRHEDEPSGNWRSVRGPDESVSSMRRYPADYASVWVEGQAVGAGRVAIADNWGVISEVFVGERHRRYGVGTAVVQALGGSARDSGVDRLAVSVSADNAEALALYGRLGFRKHHMYRHRMFTERSVKGAS
jgi:ribosomal protein S18 acetylase RimI-like enzyme